MPVSLKHQDDVIGTTVKLAEETRFVPMGRTSKEVEWQRHTDVLVGDEPRVYLHNVVIDTRPRDVMTSSDEKYALQGGHVKAAIDYGVIGQLNCDVSGLIDEKLLERFGKGEEGQLRLRMGSNPKKPGLINNDRMEIDCKIPQAELAPLSDQQRVALCEKAGVSQLDDQARVLVLKDGEPTSVMLLRSLAANLHQNGSKPVVNPVVKLTLIETLKGWSRAAPDYDPSLVKDIHIRVSLLPEFVWADVVTYTFLRDKSLAMSIEPMTAQDYASWAGSSSENVLSLSALDASG